MTLHHTHRETHILKHTGYVKDTSSKHILKAHASRPEQKYLKDKHQEGKEEGQDRKCGQGVVCDRYTPILVCGTKSM